RASASSGSYSSRRCKWNALTNASPMAALPAAAASRRCHKAAGIRADRSCRAGAGGQRTTARLAPMGHVIPSPRPALGWAGARGGLTARRQGLAGPGIPDEEGVVGSLGDDAPAVDAEADRRHIRIVADAEQDARPRIGCQVPDAQVAVEAAGRQPILRRV